jgi:hypothetical protein
MRCRPFSNLSVPKFSSFSTCIIVPGTTHFVQPFQCLELPIHGRTGTSVSPRMVFGMDPFQYMQMPIASSHRTYILEKKRLFLPMGPFYDV